MEWIHYVLLGALPAIAAFGGPLIAHIIKVVREHKEDADLIETLAKRLADKDDPLSPEEFEEHIANIRREFGESKQAWVELISYLKNLAAKKA